MDELFTIREIAERLKISVSSLYRDVEQGRFPHVKIGSNIRFTDEHIAAFLAGNPAKARSGNAFASSPGTMPAFYQGW
jgi:excisionase family DNA binding protein